MRRLRIARSGKSALEGGFAPLGNAASSSMVVLATVVTPVTLALRGFARLAQVITSTLPVPLKEAHSLLRIQERLLIAV